MWTKNMTRREILQNWGTGFGMLGLASLLADEAQASPLTPARRGDKKEFPHIPPVGRGMGGPKAKRVIFLFMSGGPSHVDTFDPKPRLTAETGKPLPFAKPSLERTKTGNLLGSPWQFKKHGQCGTEVSELFPKVAECVDDMCVIRSMVADNINHNGACLQMNTGEQAFSRPSLGSWLLYGLGTANKNLPGYVVLSPAQPAQGAPLWTSSFLPAEFQGTLVSDLKNPIANLSNAKLSAQKQREQLDLLSQLCAPH